MWATWDPVSKERWGRERRKKEGRRENGLGRLESVLQEGEFLSQAWPTGLLGLAPLHLQMDFIRLLFPLVIEALGESIYTKGITNSPVVLCNPDPTGNRSELWDEEAGTCSVPSKAQSGPGHPVHLL